MAKAPAPRPYTVLHPGPLQPLADGLWAIDDDVPGLPGARRRMAVIRRQDGALVFFNAVPVPDDTLAAIAALGRPAQLIVPNQFHMLDSAAFAARLGLTIYAPAAALAAARLRHPTEPIDALPPDPQVQVITVGAFKTGEVDLVVRRGAGAALVTADLVTNAPHGPGLTGLLMRLVGFTGPAPRLPPPVRLRVLRDKPAARALLERLAATPGLDLLVPSHGDVYRGDVPAALRAVAASF